MKRLIMFVIAFFLLAGSAWAMDVTLGWDANSETDLAGYKVYQGAAAGGPYTMIKDLALTSPGFVPASPEYKVTNLVRGTRYFWVVTAYDSEVPSLESGYSNEVTTNGGPQSPVGTRIKVVVDVQLP